MQAYAELITILQGHAQRYFDIWNFQIVVAVAVMGFVMSRDGLTAKRQTRMNITVVFLLMAVFSVYTLSIHHNHESLLWNAIQSRIAADSVQLTPFEIQYLDSLKPLSFLRKAAALIFVDALVIVVTWLSPKVRKDLEV
ncbi:MAG: hypothetical protein U0V02_14865 [Anaerolineales bacterium]